MAATTGTRRTEHRSGNGATALLFERDAVQELDWPEPLPKLRSSALLWIDLERPGAELARTLADQLELADESAERLVDGGPLAEMVDFGPYVHVVACAPGEDRELRRIVCLVSERWVVTAHDTPLDVIDAFRERAMGSGETGDVNGLEFLADILEWVLNSYLEAFEEIERSLEEIDAAAMGGKMDSHEEALGRLVGYRREIGSLRRALTSHREAVLSLARPELEAIASSDSAKRYEELRLRLEEAVQGARDCRDAVVGSFDVLLASTGQRTNDIMKVLTLATVVLLPGSLIAGILGMNFRVSLFRDASNFWLALAVIVTIAAGTLVLARLRSWI